MLTVILNLLFSSILTATLIVTDLLAWYWALLIGIACVIVIQLLLGLLLRKKMTAMGDQIQAIMQKGQTKIQAKMQRWQIKPMGNVKLAQAEIARDTAAMIGEARAVLDQLRRYNLWIPFLGKQLATLDMQFAWQIKDFKQVDALIPQAFIKDPLSRSLKLARMIQKKQPAESIKGEFETMTKRIAYDQSALLYATYSWYLVKANALDEALAVITEGCQKNEHRILKQNKDLLANNNTSLFSNAGFGDEWYALFLEEPKVKMQRKNPRDRSFF